MMYFGGPQPEVDKLLKLTNAIESFYKIESLEIYVFRNYTEPDSRHYCQASRQ